VCGWNQFELVLTHLVSRAVPAKQRFGIKWWVLGKALPFALSDSACKGEKLSSIKQPMPLP